MGAIQQNVFGSNPSKTADTFSTGAVLSVFSSRVILSAALVVIAATQTAATSARDTDPVFMTSL